MSLSVDAQPAPPYSSKDDVVDTEKGEGLVLDKQTSMHEGEQKFHQLSWQKLTVCLIVEAIALGSLSVPSAFAKVGMVAGVLLTVGIGLIAIYTSHVIGQVKLKYPHIRHYADATKLIWGRFGYELGYAMTAIFLILLVGSHTLTGTIAFINIVDNYTICAIVWGVISAIILFVVALPPTFSEFALLGYIDFISIICAILITIVATGIQASDSPGGMASVPWSVWPPEGVTFYEAFLSTTNIIFAYSFAVCQFTFMGEMHTPTDYQKSIWALGLIEIFIYTLTGSLVYAFVGVDVKSPALLSAGALVSRVAFGVALPVIFISGSINSTVVGRMVVDRFWPDSPIRFINDVRGWSVWVGLIAIITIISWIIAAAIPFFNALLGLISSLFISGFTFYFPALFWFMLVKEGKWNKDWHNTGLSIANGIVFVIGMAILGCGTYASVQDIVNQYASGSVRSPFTCEARAYT